MIQENTYTWLRLTLLRKALKYNFQVGMLTTERMLTMECLLPTSTSARKVEAHLPSPGIGKQATPLLSFPSFYPQEREETA